jgi:hypothetical protein
MGSPLRDYWKRAIGEECPSILLNNTFTTVCSNMEGENRVNRLKIQRLESRRKTRDIYKVVGCLMPDWLCALTSAQLKLSSVRFMQQSQLQRSKAIACEAGWIQMGLQD